MPDCGGATTQSLSENLDSLRTIRARAGLANNNSLFFGLEGSNSEDWLTRNKTTKAGIAGKMVRGTPSYQFDW
jgi:hypothetical protein